MNVQKFNATGDGVTDDRPAIQSALDAAALLGGDVYFPPGTYIVGRSGTNPWCLDMPGDNLTLRGVKGASWIKAAPGMPATSVAVLRINERSNITLSGLGIDGNWGNALTEIAAASDGVALQTGTINVKSTAGFPAAGTIQVMTSVGVTQTVNYTGITATSFTGCTGGTGTMFRGGVVGRRDDNTGINHATQVDPKNYGIPIRGSTKILIDNCLIQQTYGDGIWLGHSASDGNVWTQDVRITNTYINITARDGIAFGQACEGIYIGHTNFTNIISQAIDSEPGDQPVRDVVIEHCRLGGWWNPGNPARTANAPLSIVGGKFVTGSQTILARKFRVRDCTIDGSCIIESAVDVVLERNRIVTDFDGNSYAPVLVSFFCDDLWVLDNEIYDRTADASAGRHAGSITVTWDGLGATTMQPSGVTVRGNRIHARHGRHGIQIVGTGARARAHSALSSEKLLPDESDVATTVTATTLARAGAGWAVDQWQGRFVRIGKATAGIASNTADTLTLYVPAFQTTAWYTPLGALVVTPAAGAYVIYGIGGVVDIDGNDIDCTDDGNGAGGMGIHLWAARAGMRVRCRNNKIKNAGTDAIKVQSVDANRPFLYLGISNNHAWDDQRIPTCTAAIRFTSPRFVDRLVLCGNSVEGAIAPVAGLDSGVWLVEEGLPERWAGWGSPNGVIAARIGAMYQQLAPGGASALWVKQAADGQNTGWVGVASPTT